MPYINIGGPGTPVPKAPHSDKIMTDTGWTTTEGGRCYFKNTRQVVFSADITDEQLFEFAAFEKKKMYGQVQIVKIDPRTLTVNLTHGVDSGD